MSIQRNSILLIVSTLVASWLGMQIVHESGHYLAALVSGGKVESVQLKPWSISQTQLSENPKPLIVVWGGPVIGVVLPFFAWMMIAKFKLILTSFLRFFSGFCFVTNGIYIGIGSFFKIGDCGEMLNHGSPIWLLWLFGMIATPIGFAMWNGQGKHFGIGLYANTVRMRDCLTIVFIAVGLLTFCTIYSLNY